jgi:hypothetical protein
VFSRELLPDGTQGKATPLGAWQVLLDILPHDLLKEARHHRSYLSAAAPAGGQQPGSAGRQHSHPGQHGHSHGYSAAAGKQLPAPEASPAGRQPRTTDYL